MEKDREKARRESEERIVARVAKERHQAQERFEAEIVRRVNEELLIRRSQRHLPLLQFVAFVC